MSKTFCPYPYIHLHNFPDGRVAPCCDYKSDIKKDSGESFHIQEDSISEIYKSNNLQQLRNKLDSGVQAEECRTCWKKEATGLLSKRLSKLDEMKDKTVDEIVNLSSELPSEMQIILNNSCNLKCRMCGPKYSTLWAKEMKLYSSSDKLALHKQEFILPKGQPGSKDGLFMKDIEVWGKNLTHLEIVGGEPFYSVSWAKVLKALIDLKYASNIVLKITTNGTIVDIVYIQHLIDNFKNIQIGVSIDGYGPIFDYIRSGGSWEEVSSNLAKLYDLKHKNLEKFFLSIIYTYNWLNIIQLPEFIILMSKKYPDVLVNLNSITLPLEWNINTAPPDFRVQIVERLEHELSRGTFIRKPLEEEVRSVVELLKNNTLSKSDNFTEYEKIYIVDKYRSTNILTVIEYIENNFVLGSSRLEGYSVTKDLKTTMSQIKYKNLEKNNII